MENIIISIITPVYNAEEYLPKCIESILEQNFKAFELILIDDGSQDCSRNICEEYASLTNKIQFIHKNNGGVSLARNKGIEIARGKYITFIDADDYVKKDYLSSLYEAFQLIPNENGLVIQGYTRFHEKEIVSIKRLEEKLYSLECEKEIFHDLALHLLGYPWGKLYNADIINRYNLAFPTGVNYGEDLIFMLNYLVHIDFISSSNATEYYYRSFNTNSLFYNYNNYESELKGYHLLRKAFENIKSKYEYTDKQLEGLHNGMMYFMMRAVKTMYKPKTKLSYTKRLKIYHTDFSSKEYIELIEFYQSSNRIDVYIKYCIKNHYWRILDLLLFSFYILRYSSICNKLYILHIKHQIKVH